MDGEIISSSEGDEEVPSKEEVELSLELDADADDDAFCLDQFQMLLDEK